MARSALPSSSSDRPGLAVLLLTVAVVAAVAAWHWHWFLDLQVYRRGVAAMPGGDLYTARYRVADLPFTYPPFAALALAPVALLPWPLAAAVWAAAGVAALAVVVRTVLDRCAPEVDAPVWLIVLPALALQPVWSTLSFGQVNLVLMTLVVVDVLGPRRRWSGALIGIAAGIKLTPLFLLLLLVLIGRRRAALVGAGTVLLTAVATAAALPRESWAYWTSVLLDPGRIGAPEYAGNQSLNGLLPRLLGHEVSTALWFAVAAPVGAAALAIARARWRDEDGRAQVLALGAAATGMLLCSPISWDHHWVWFVPVLLVLALDARPPAARTARGLALALTALLLSRAIWWAPYRDGREFAWGPLQQLSGNAYVWAGLALLVLVALDARRDQARGRSSSSATQRAASGRRSSGSPPSSMRSQAN